MEVVITDDWFDSPTYWLEKSNKDVVINTTDGFNAELVPIMKYNSQLTIDKDGSDGIRPLIGITSVIDCPPDEHFK